MSDLAIFGGCALLLFGVGIFSIKKVADRDRKETANRLEKAPVNVLNTVECVKDDLLYLGRGSEIVSTKVEKVPQVPVYIFECLCKTGAGNWFILEFEFNAQLDCSDGGNVHPIKIDTAKGYLSKQVTEYKKHFGELETA